MKFTVFKLALVALGSLVHAIAAAELTPLQEARAQLEGLKQKYGDQHPTIIEQKAKIAALEKQGADSPSKASREAAKSFSIDFPGGTVRDFLNAVAKLEGVSLSIIANDPADLKTPLPAFSLRNSGVQTVVMALMRLLETRGYNLNPVGMEPNSVVAVLARQEPRPKAAPPPPPTLFDSFPLGTYLADQTIDDIVGAIRAGWELDPAHDKESLRLKFHPGTSILLVSGPPEAIQIASKVISQLKGAYDKDSKSNLRKITNPDPVKH